MGSIPSAVAAVLASYLNVPMRTDSYNNMQIDLQNPALLGVFLCPADEISQASVRQKQIGCSWGLCQPTEFSSYGTNAEAFGWQDQTGFKRLRGWLGGLAHPSEQFMMGDGLAWPGWGLLDFYDSNLTGTLWNAYLNNSAQFDLIRHRGSMNGLFLDGHVETFPITQASLSNFYLAKDISQIN